MVTDLKYSEKLGGEPPRAEEGAKDRLEGAGGGSPEGRGEVRTGGGLQSDSSSRSRSW